MSLLVAYLPAVGTMLIFFGAMVFQARAHPQGRVPVQTERSLEREQS